MKPAILLPGGDTVPILAFSAFVYKLEEAQRGPWFSECLAEAIEPPRLVERARKYAGQAASPCLDESYLRISNLERECRDGLP